MGFDDNIKRLKNLTEAYDLSVLVWGPAEATEHFEKRAKIRDEARRCFPKAEVYFSEELDLKEHLPGLDPKDFAELELWHLAACDVCIVLDISKGAGEEIALYSKSLHAHKLLILTHEKFESDDGFPAMLRKKKNQLFYNDHEYETCNLVEHVLSRLRTVALGKIIGFRV